ncbi:hypothetical protein LOTGIDRAFT_109572 [Lottia gigantea]|uniref:BTB domain-containing protein n=1 Tax=Lottia gigantea TaxID=225164 RepID=V4CR40_LOTGI|nr:hypothetical protein LOTGIDRAFT_109572 [Lottia gigantea]ESP04945.1 hypothetical protein LOTGIDRAFT_109572 [Lottia gigantea]
MNTLSSGLERLMSSHAHSDTTIDVEGRSFKCHRAILAAMSPYFDAMFSSGMRESITGDVSIHGISADIFGSIVNYIYSGYDIVNEENALQVLHASALLQIECLMKRSEDFVCRKITDANCVEAYRKAMVLNCAQLKQKSKERILSNFVSLCESSEFYQMDADEMAMVVKEDNLECPSEEYVCDRVVDWVEYDLENREKDLKNIFTHLRLSLVKSEYIVDVLEKRDFIKKNADCVKIIDEAKNFQLLPSRRHDFSSVYKLYRKTSTKEDVLVLISGGETPKPPYVRSKDVLAYSSQKHAWFHLAQLPYDPGIEFATCVYDNDIFVSGGGARPRCFLRYRAKKNKWSQRGPELNFGRRRHAMVAMGSRLYVVGGFNSERPEGDKVLDVIEEYTLEDNAWREVAKLAVPVSSVSAAALKDKIFIFGGETNTKSDTNSIQCYDTNLKCTTIIGELPMTCKLTRSVVCDDQIYIVLFDGQILRFCDGENSELVSRIPKFERVHFGLLHLQGYLYIMGGQYVSGPDSRALCDLIGRFDTRTNTYCQLSERLPSARLLDSCAKISVEKKFLIEEHLDE